MKERPATTPEQQEAYIESLYAADPDLEEVRRTLQEKGVHDISVAPGYGRLLTLLVQTSGAGRILEIGAFGGYSGICLARGLPEGGKLLSLELKQEFADLARSNMEKAGLGHKVEYRVGEALPELRRLEAEGERFDFFFIDADKGNYVNYLEMAIKLGRPGAIIAGDNTFLRGRTLHAEDQGQSARRIRRFNELIASHPDLDSTILPAYDGLALARIKSFYPDLP